jgi:UDP-N-acetyl-D-mannosaminuronic acid dehydrogenase
MKISVIGMGYIGLPTSAILASKNMQVVGVDVNQQVVDTINKGMIHIVEPGLGELVKSVVQSKSLKASLLVEPSDVFIIAVPTPFGDNHKPDTSYINDAIASITPVLSKGNIIILESTSPVGATEEITQQIQSARPDLKLPMPNEDDFYDIYVAHCPERVMPGNILHELVENDRIIGGVTKECAKKAKEIYEIFVHNKCVITDARTAELCKLVENSYRDVNIAFANELSQICEKLRVNVWELIRLANRHPRVDILKPGPGVGGHCIAVDPWFIVDSAPNESKLIHTARQVNNNKPKYVLSQIKHALISTGKNINEISISCFGLAFKADIDDLRESPSVEIAKSLDSMGFKNLFLIEPNISELPDIFSSNSILSKDYRMAIRDSDIVVILVDHSEFKIINTELFLDKIMIDTCGIYQI